MRPLTSTRWRLSYTYSYQRASFSGVSMRKGCPHENKFLVQPDPKYPLRTNCQCLRLWPARCRVARSLQCSHCGGSERSIPLQADTVTQAWRMPHETPASPPCSASGQNHIHLTIYSERVLRAYFSRPHHRDGALCARYCVAAPRHSSLWLVATPCPEHISPPSQWTRPTEIGSKNVLRFGG